MPMSPRLLRPRASAALVAVDADARTYINAVRIADGGQYMEAGVQRAIDAFVTGCKSDGIWSSIKACCLLAGPRTLAGINVPLVGSTPTFNAFTASEYNRETGLVGNGSTMYIDSGRNNNADPQNSQHLAIYASAVSASSRHYMGAGDSAVTGASVLIAAASAGAAFRVRNRSATIQSATGADAVGFMGTTRGAAASYVARASGTSSTHSITSGTPQSANVFVFGSNNSGLTLPTAARLAFYSIGENIDLALLDSRVTTLYTAIGAAI